MPNHEHDPKRGFERRDQHDERDDGPAAEAVDGTGAEPERLEADAFGREVFVRRRERRKLHELDRPDFDRAPEPAGEDRADELAPEPEARLFELEAFQNVAGERFVAIGEPTEDGRAKPRWRFRGVRCVLMSARLSAQGRSAKETRTRSECPSPSGSPPASL